MTKKDPHYLRIRGTFRPTLFENEPANINLDPDYLQTGPDYLQTVMLSSENLILALIQTNVVQIKPIHPDITVWIKPSLFSNTFCR